MSNVLQNDADMQTHRPVRKISEETGTISEFRACDGWDAWEPSSWQGVDGIASDYLLQGMNSIWLLENRRSHYPPGQEAES